MLDLQHVYAVVLTALIFVPLEWVLPARKAPKPDRQRYMTDILHVIVGGFFIRVGTVLVLLGLIFYGPVSDAYGLPLWLQLPILIAMRDFGFYWVHRMYHSVPFLWRFHRIHHSSEHLDWLASYRLHPLDQSVHSAIVLAPTVILDFDPMAVLIVTAIYRWHTILLHSNVRIGFGPLEKVISAPAFHHWHHANEEQAHDRNFGGQLTIWDRMFGTFYDAQTPRPSRYGVDDPPRENFLTHTIEPFLPGKKNG